MSSNPYQSSSLSPSSTSSSTYSYHNLNSDRYVMVNVWTAKEDEYIPGHNVGHVSIQTRDAYYSLWPAPRAASDHVSRSDLSTVEKIARDLLKNFAKRPARYIQSYEMDCLLEGISEGYILPYTGSNKIPADGYKLVVFDEDTKLFRIAELYPPQLQLDKTEILTWIRPIQANVRLALYSLDVGRISNEFTALRGSVEGWSMAGSNRFQQALGTKTKESCATLAYRLLSAGGFQSLLSPSRQIELSSQTSSFVEPGVLAKAIVTAKCEEQSQAKTAITTGWRVEGESELEPLKQCYHINSGEASNSSISLSNLFRK